MPNIMTRSDAGGVSRLPGVIDEVALPSFGRWSHH
jgi:hypothetical protein